MVWHQVVSTDVFCINVARRYNKHRHRELGHDVWHSLLSAYSMFISQCPLKHIHHCWPHLLLKGNNLRRHLLDRTWIYFCLMLALFVLHRHSFGFCWGSSCFIRDCRICRRRSLFGQYHFLCTVSNDLIRNFIGFFSFVRDGGRDGSCLGRGLGLCWLGCGSFLGLLIFLNSVAIGLP